MKNENSVMAILAAAVGALCSYAAALVVPLAVLLAVMVGDYVSGMAKAWSTGKLCSKTGLRGILKKLGYLALVGVAGVVDWLVRYGLTQRDELRSGHSQTISKSSRAAAYTNARCTFRAATTVRDPFPQVSARYSIARMHWLDPSVEYTVRPEPNSFPA